MARAFLCRKNHRRLLGILFGCFVSLNLVAGIAFAGRSLSIESVAIEARVLPDATLDVIERITVNFSGTWNGFFVKIPQGNTPVENVMVSEKGHPYAFNPGSDYGPPGTFLTKPEGDELLIDWSIAATNETRSFDVSYKVTNAVKIHADTAELYRKFVGSANENKVGSVTVTVHLPPGAEKYEQGKDIRIWGHGPQNGEIDFAGPDTVVLLANALKPFTFVEGRITMPVELFPSAPQESVTGKRELENILAEETRWAKEANRGRFLARAEVGGAGVVLVVCLTFMWFLWRKFGRKHETVFQGDYYRELPAKYSPAELSVLYNFNKMQTRDLTATILDLARRGFLQLREDVVEERRFLGTKTTNTFLVQFSPPPEPDDLGDPAEAVLKPHEQNLVKFLQSAAGENKESVYLTEVEKYAKKSGAQFLQFWKSWTAGAAVESEQHSFFENNDRLKVQTTLTGVVLALLGGVIAVRKASLLGAAIFVSGLIFLFVPRAFKRRSITGQEDYVRWKAFRRFLLHFSEMQRHEIPSLVLWEQYLVYAVTLGVAKEVIRQLQIVFPNLQEGDYRFGSSWWVAYGVHSSLNNFSSSLDGIGASLQRSLQTAQRAASRSSSGSGGGGGFSGGGGGGGGGSSYGGR